MKIIIWQSVSRFFENLEKNFSFVLTKRKKRGIIITNERYIYDKEGILCIVESVGKNFHYVFARTKG